MNFGKFDVTMILTMTLAVVSMSFVFPAIGLADAGTDANNIPEYRLDTEALNLAGEFPRAPGTPSTGNIWLQANDTAFSNNQIWLDGGTSGGTEMVLLPAQGGDPTQLLINNWDSGSVTGEERRNLTDANDTFVINNFSYQMTFRTEEFREPQGNGTDGYYELSYNIRDQPESGGGWIGRIPVVGGVVGTAEATAAVLGWFGSILWWFFATAIDLVSAAVVVLYDTLTFGAALLDWLVTTYAAIVSNAGPSWVSLFVALPGIILSLEFGKLAMIGVSLLPTT